MNYLKKSFTVSAPASKSYSDNWEQTFRDQKKPWVAPSVRTLKRVAYACFICGEPLYVKAEVEGDEGRCLSCT